MNHVDGGNCQPDSPGKTPKYQPLPICCDLAESSLVECVQHLEASRLYTLTVHPSSEVWVGQMLHRFTSVPNPFAPHVNLATDETLHPYEWYLSNGKSAWGARGL